MKKNLKSDISDIKAMQLGARFSLPPNSLGYCGKDSAPEKFKKCIRNSDCSGVSVEFTKFLVLYPYLKTLAKIASSEFDSYKVIEAFWLGNDELQKATLADYDFLMDCFIDQGVPEFFVKNLRKKRPKIFIPFHLFQVLHVGVGNASGAVKFNLDSINNCMIRWGKVNKIKNEEKILEVNLFNLKKSKDKYKLYEKIENISFDKSILKNIKVGDTVAVHWGMIIKTLTDSEVNSLSSWTAKVIEII